MKFFSFCLCMAVCLVGLTAAPALASDVGGGIDITGFLGQLLGVAPAEVLGLLAVVSLVCRLVGKRIPDDETGVLGMIRVVCKVLGLYVSNRVVSGVTTTDAARGALTIANVAKVAREKE